MNCPILRSFQGVSTFFAKNIISSRMHPVSNNLGVQQIWKQYLSVLSITNNINLFKSINFLKPELLQYNQVCGMKVKGRLELRCKGCYYIARQGRLYVMCRIAPRHKQMQMMKSFEKRRILTFAQQKKKREW